MSGLSLGIGTLNISTQTNQTVLEAQLKIDEKIEGNAVIIEAQCTVDATCASNVPVYVLINGVIILKYCGDYRFLQTL